MTASPDPLGRGWAFPPVPENAALSMRSGPALVRQSILLILDTEPGERVMRPEFGCGLRRHLMEPNNPATRAAIARDVDAALRTWEPRIELREVDVVPTDDLATVLVTISYAHVRDQSPGGLSVPLTLAGG
ncbi:GPW/gp25 family protein [Geodermatophilus sp. SYSU D01176]